MKAARDTAFPRGLAEKPGRRAALLPNGVKHVYKPGSKWGDFAVFGAVRGAIFCIGLCAVPAFACDWEADVWHHVCAESPLYSAALQDRPSAAIVQADGHFVHFILGDADQGALVTASLPAHPAEASLGSSLVMTDGSILSRTVTGDQLWAEMSEDGTAILYSFRVAPADVDLFRAGSQWTITAGAHETEVSLRGSNAAIAQAIEYRDRQASAATRPDAPQVD